MILEALVSARTAVPRQRLSPPGNRFFNQLLEFIDPTRRTTSGVKVSDDLAWNVSCFYCGVNIIANGFASPPMILYRRKGNDERERATDHPLFDLFHSAPNPEQTPFTFFHTALAHTLSWGNHYSEIARDRRKRVEELWPLMPDRVRPRRVEPGERIRVVGWDNRRMTPPTGRLIYEVRTDDSSKPLLLDRDKVLHPQGLGFNGIQGFSVLRMARESLGLSVASEQFAAGFYGNHAVPAGFLNVPEGTDPDQETALLKSMEDRHAAAEQAHRLGVLPAGVTFQKLTTDPVDALMLEVRRFSTEEWARWLDIPIHFLKDLTNAGVRANVAQETLNFATHTVRPWHVRYEQELNRKLLSESERREYYFEALTESIVRFDLLTKYKALWQAIQGGWMSVNDARRKENMNGIGEQGDLYRWPVNAVPASVVASGEYLPGGRAQQRQGKSEAAGGQRKAETTPEGPIETPTKPSSFTTEKRTALVNTHLGPLEDAFSRLVGKEVKSLKRLHDRYGAEEGVFLQKVTEFYGDHSGFVARTLAPHVDAVAAAVKASLACDRDLDWPDPTITEHVALRHCERAVTDIKKGSWKPWSEKTSPGRAAGSARYELNRLHNAAVVEVCAAMGRTIRWRCVRNDEPFAVCHDLDGKEVLAGGRFTDLLEAGYRPRLRHPPVDFGCECQLEIVEGDL